MEFDAFREVIPVDEKILAVLGAPRQDENGQAMGWVHLALTEKQLWVVDVNRDLVGGQIRYAHHREFDRRILRLSRHPRTSMTSARIEIQGMEESLFLVDLDQPDLFVQLRPFLAAWGSPVDGDGPISLISPSLWRSDLRPRSSRIRPGIVPGLLFGVFAGLGLYWWVN